jgi:RHS repeat-associated protein
MLKKNILLAFSFIFIFIQNTFGGWENPQPSRIGATVGCGSFNQFDVVRSHDGEFINTIHTNPSAYLDKNVINRIVLGISRDCVNPGTSAGFTVNAPYELQVDITVDYLNASEASAWITATGVLGTGTCGSCSKTTVTRTLTVKYDPNYQTTETELSFFEFSGGYDAKVTVTDIRLNGTSQGTSPNNVYIENIIAIERYQDMNLSSQVALSPVPITNEEITVTSSSGIDGAENYDIEWTYIDWESGVNQGGNIERFNFTFKNNASRINTKSTANTIPAIYPRGIILFRLRANGVVLPNTDDLVSTVWSGEESGTIDVDPTTGVVTPVSPTALVYGLYLSGFSQNMTWQHSVSFAEEGKKKQVISYFDGSLYNRQSITKNNSDNKAIVGQTVYDFSGRPAVQLLPTPLPSTVPTDHNLTFKPNFNQTNGATRAGETYNYLDFDIDANSLNCVDSRTSRLSNSSGAEKYYSANNPFTDATHRDRIPKANGYAFTQTEYMPDNTGRVRRQGGVGEAHRLTGDDELNNPNNGKETKYYYGVPNQTELYRMFANEAGNSNRYKKNIVIDPNGQVSISYIDPMGRVVATSLAGDPNNSSNMEPVAGRNPETITIDIIEKNSKNFVDLTITAEYDNFVVNDNSTQKFWYRLAVPMLTYQCGTTSFCYDCVYDINISITDECGTEQVPSQYRNNKVGINPPPEHSCGSDSIVFETDGFFQLTLNQGSYKIKRTISIDKSALNDYIDNLLASPNISDCITSYDDLVTQKKSESDYTNCNYTCEKCTTEAQTLLTAQKITQQEHDDMILACEVFCKQTTPCDALYQQMIADISPGGQYFDNIKTVPISPATTSLYEDKIKNNQVEDVLPAVPDNTWLDAAWTDHTNNPRWWTPNLFGASGVLTLKLNQSGVIIDDWDDVRFHWIDEFADDLIKIHPEWTVYDHCNAIKTSYAYDDELRSTTTAAEAITNGYYNPTNMGISPFAANNLDPLFIQYPSYKTFPTFGMDDALIDYQLNFDEDGAMGPNPPVTYNIWEFVDYWLEKQGSDIQGCLTDYGWAMFRAGYLAKKQIVYNKLFYGGNTAVTIDPGFKRRFYYDDTHDDDDFDNVFDPDGTDPLKLPGAGSNEATYNDYTAQEMKQHCEQACSTYIDQWKRELEGCGLTPTEMTDVITKLLEVCKAGCDSYDPVGSRFAKPGTTTTSGVRSFREAIGSHYIAEVCDDLLIQWPRGNYHDYWAEITPYANRCTCLPNQQAPTPANTCATCGESLTPDGIKLKENLELAEKEKCKNCITCVNLAEGLKALDEKYNTTFTPDNANKHIIMENYFNLRYSFNLTYLEYLDFMRDCAGEDDITSTTVADFRTNMKDFVDPDPIINGGQQLLSGGQENPQSQQDTLEIPDSTMQQSPPILVLDSLGFGGGSTSAASAPAGFEPLDECGCNYLLDMDIAYNATPPDPCAVGKTFEQYVDQCGGTGSCEGLWSGLDINAMLLTCKDAIAKTNRNAYTGVGFVWMDVQKNSLSDYVHKDNRETTPKLFIPEDCACPPPNEVIIEVDEGCNDCITGALDKYLDYMEDCLGSFTIEDENGVAQTKTKQEMFDYLTASLVSRVEKSYDAGTNTYTYTHYKKCKFGESWTNPTYFGKANVFAGCGYLTFDDYLMFEGCVDLSGKNGNTRIYPPNPPNPPSDWPFFDPPAFCNTCYKQDNDLLTKTLNFLNDLKESSNPSRTQAGGYLTTDWWDIDPTAPNYLVSPLYTGTCSTSLKYEVPNGYWLTGRPQESAPTLTFKITDALGGAGCTHVTEWTLAFQEYNDDYTFTDIIEFTEILAAPRASCSQNLNQALVAVKIKTPNGVIKEIKYLTLTLNSSQYVYTEDPLICKQLCNKPILPKVEATDPCADFLDRVAESNAANEYERQIKDLREEFTRQYINKCMSVYDYFRTEYTLDEYHYTLYYYDQGDNLIKTVPPKGVNLLNSASIDSCYLYDFPPISSPRILPNHNYITNYKYNTLNQLVEQTTPDAGVSKFWYDILGRIVLSQNARQAAYNGPSNEKKYSYTLYDGLGRISEAGEIELPSATAADVNPANAATPSWVETHIEQASTKTQITRTYYDAAPTWQTALTIPNFTPTNLRNRVVVTCFYETYPTNPEDYNHATHYSYDVLGNVYHLVQDFPELEPMGQRYKNIKYNYDLASGNVNLVSYQPDELDQFYHYYVYDADNRITDVYTARNPAINEIDMARSTPSFTPGLGWQKDAKYFYYLHGPLARMELGQNKVQGTDYSYTIHGWLKAVNDGFMQNAHDPGLDGNLPSVGTNDNRWHGRDAIGFELGYYNTAATLGIEDYNAIGNNSHISTKAGSNYGNSSVSLYNGNISQMVTTLPDKTQLSTNNAVIASPRGANYRYDQLNRIKESVNFTNAHIPNYEWNNNLTPGTVPQEWYTKYTYDPMGNIETLKRQDGTGGDMDDLTYHYDGATPSWKNQLLYVDDSKAAGLHTEDIDDQSTGNYAYDEIGNLIQDNAEEIQTIEWTVYGKIKSITRTGVSTKANLEFEYNTAGQRVIKRVLPNNGDKPTSTFYLRDASGNIMATYKQYIEIIGAPDIAEERLAVEEWNLYGSSRLGAYSKEEIIASRIGVYTGGAFIPGNPDTYTINGVPAMGVVFDEEVGYKNYELSNHLGNVLATITDRKVPDIDVPNSLYNYYNAQITSIADYYPFGMQIEERSWTAPSNKYRFGFNGQEKENDITGEGNHVVFSYRIHDTRLGRFLSVDPMENEYPWNSSYAFAENRVIDGIDLEGKEFMKRTSLVQFLSFRPKNEHIQHKDILITNVITWNIALNIPISDATIRLRENHRNAPEAIRDRLVGQSPNTSLLRWISYHKSDKVLAEVAAQSGKKSNSIGIGTGSINFISLMIDAYLGYKKYDYQSTHMSAIQHYNNSVNYASMAINLSRIVHTEKILPDDIASSRAYLADLTNYLIDGTRPQSNNMDSYINAMTSIGKAIYENRDYIKTGSYKFERVFMKTIVNTAANMDLSNNSAYQIQVEVEVTDPYTKKALEDLEIYRKELQELQNPQTNDTSTN